MEQVAGVSHETIMFYDPVKARQGKARANVSMYDACTESSVVQIRVVVRTIAFYR